MTRQEFVNFFYDVCYPDVESRQDVLNEWEIWLESLEEEGEDVDLSWTLKENELSEVLKLRARTPLSQQQLNVDCSINWRLSEELKEVRL